MKRLFVYIFLIVLIITACSKQEEKVQFSHEEYNLDLDEGTIYGTLTLPEGKGPFPVALIIAGSGPTDRDGNNPLAGVNNSLKMLAEALAENSIASVRYDKRGIAESKDLMVREEDLRFEDYVEDAAAWMDKLNRDERFKGHYIIGHSEGALIGVVAANKSDVEGYISIAGVGRPADDLLKEQLKNQSEYIYKKSLPVIEELKKGNLVPDIDKELEIIFRPSVQPYLISWFKYDPREEIGKLKEPILILQGDKDLQVSVDDAESLFKSISTRNKMEIIKGMNHVLKNVSGDEKENIKSYSNPDLPIDQDLVAEIVKFIGR